MWFKKEFLDHLLCVFILYQLVSKRLASAGTATNERQTPQTNKYPLETHDHQPPYWPRYSGSRRVRLLDGIWKVGFLESQNRSDLGANANVGDRYIRFDSMDPSIDISKINTTENVTIPSTLEVIADPENGFLPGFMGYRGVAFFRTNFETNQDVGRGSSRGVAARIQFQACSFYCRVWLNGVEIGDHIGGGYVAWWLDVTNEVLELGQKHYAKHNFQKPSKDEIGDFVCTTHELFVLVDNRFNSTTAPLHTGGDFWHYGGIMRSVEWHDGPNLWLPEAGSAKTSASSSRTLKRRRLTGDFQKMNASVSNPWPWRLYVQPQRDMKSVKLSLQLVEGEKGHTRYGTDADLWKELRLNEQIKIYFDGDVTKNMLDEVSQTRPPSSGVVESGDEINRASRRSDRLVRLGIFSVPNPRIWSTADPQLHTVSIDLNGAIVTERFGLRVWDTGTSSTKSALLRRRTTTNATSSTANASTSHRIRLNGEILKLRGWNHHTQWPYTAASPTDEQLDEDIRLLKESGHANFVRGAHYPQDPRWLDRLDENGLVVWCETLGPSVSVENLQDDYFLNAQNQQINEMLDSAFNHASVAFWGFFNEGPSNHEEACGGYQASSDAIRARDTTRFITYASNRRPPADKCYEAVSVISYNGYPGWYDARGPEDFWNSLASDLFSGKGYPGARGKPLLISETGAGGIYEWKHNHTAVKWTLGYQEDIISRDVATAIENTNISGIALWHFFDFKVNDEWENNTHCDYKPGVFPKTCGFIDVESSSRPGGANHKGSIDFFRRTKPIFLIVASLYYSISDE